MKPNGINIELTPCQYDYLYEVLMEAYSNDVAEQKEWDVHDAEIEEERWKDELESFTATFDTAWSPPEAICRRLRDMFPKVSISWFYDEPGCQFAGYL